MPTAMVDRLVLILGAFTGTRARLSLAELAEATGLPRSSTHRILQQLVAASWLERAGADYRLGLGIFEIGSLVGHRNRILAAARPFMQELSRPQWVVHLAILDGTDVVYLDKVGGGFAGRLPSRVGGRLPAHATGVGKVMLAHSDGDVVDACVARGLRRRTTATIGDPLDLRRELDRVRAMGIALDAGEAVPGVECVAAPVFDDGVVTAAISICAPAGRADPSSARTQLLTAATAISRRLAQRDATERSGERLASMGA